MAGVGRQIFQDASDEDSIGLSSTEPSEIEEEYSVEKILDELWDEDLSEITYLVKWEGYPLHKSTWEPAENFGSSVMIDDWKRRQALIRQGKEQPFDRRAFYDLEESERLKQEDRKERRAAKRQRLGIMSRSTGGNKGVVKEESDESSEDEPLAARKRQKFSPVKRKGVAQPIKKPSTKSTARVKVRALAHEGSEDNQGDSQDSDSGDSLMDELQAKGARKATTKQKPVVSERAAQTTTMADSSASSSKKRTLAARRASEPQAASSVASSMTMGEPPAARPVMRKSVTTAPTATTKATAASTARASNDTSRPTFGATTAKPTQTAKRTSKATTSKVFTEEWDKQKTGRMRPRVSGETPKDSADPKFTKLSVQNRYQKYSVNEPTPDISKLAVFNAATGRMEQPASAAPTTRAPLPRPSSPPRQDPARQPERSARSDAPNVPARTLAPPPKPSPNPPQPARPSGQLSGSAAPLAQAHDALPRAFGRRATPPPQRTRSLSPPSEARVPTGPQMHLHDRSGNVNPEKIKTTVCRNWLAGRCAFGADCWFAHADAPPAPSTTIVPRPDSKKQVTCTYWLRPQGCAKSESQCDFAHRDTGLYRDPTGRTVTENPYKPSKSARTSGVTGSNVCPLPERTRSESQARPHNDVNVMEGQRTSNTVASPSEMAPPTAAQYQGPATDHALRKGLRRELTCSHWLRGDCRFSEASCIFAHHDTGQYQRGRGIDRIETHGAVQPAAISRPPLPERTRSELQSRTLDNAMEVDSGSAASEGTPVNGTNSPLIVPLKDRVGVSLHTHAAKLVIKDDRDAVNEVDVRLVTTRATDKPKMVEAIDSKARLDASRMVNAADLQHFCGDLLQKGMQWPVGDVTAEDGSRTALASLAELCKLNVTYGVVIATGFTLLLFPSGVEEWKFLGRAGDSPPSQGILRFKLLPAISAEALQETRSTDESAHVFETGDPMALASKHLLDLDMDRLLTINIGDDKRPKIDNVVFVMMPPSRQTEERLLEKAFETKKCKVTTSSSPGSWDRFRKSQTGTFLLVVHPEVPLYSIPSLGVFLHGPLMRIFSIGVDPSLAAMEDEQARFSSQRLFPHGSAMFITDGVLIHHPDKAANVIEAIYNANKNKPSKSSRIQVVMRPGIRAFLLDLANERTEERGRTDVRWLRLLDVVCQMSPPEFDLDYAPGNPSEKSDIVSVPPDDLPTFGDLWQTDKDAATDYIVNWFAGWSIANAANMRRFTICNETPPTGKTMIDENMKVVEQPGETDPRGWGKEYQHLLVVQPSWWLKTLKR